ncbi:unnamed protein product [Protopolystoma xenopodis]|uniref:Uncharacterized protein n=1 Tax=Protopolystoma xenopodis TaxID=117903 RepID=A0A448X9G0_9PLAT|nr:unnamed protein product [Protopolystoma xenopodis]
MTKLAFLASETPSPRLSPNMESPLDHIFLQSCLRHPLEGNKWSPPICQWQTATFLQQSFLPHPNGFDEFVCPLASGDAAI